MKYRFIKGTFYIKSNNVTRFVTNLNEISNYVNRCNNLENRSLYNNIYIESLKLNIRSKDKIVSISARKEELRLKNLKIRNIYTLDKRW